MQEQSAEYKQTGGELAMKEMQEKEKNKEKENELNEGFTEGMKGSSTEHQTANDIEMKSCNSSNVFKHGFLGMDAERETGLLAVEFIGGSLYHYFDVPAHLYEEMCGCDSVGKFINNNIKNNYEYKKVEKAHTIDSI